MFAAGELFGTAVCKPGKTSGTNSAEFFKYIIAVFIGGALYGTMSSFVKLANASGFCTAQVAFFQALFAAFILWRLTCFFGAAKNAKISPREIAETLFAGCAIGMANLLYYRSLEYISASVAVVILMQFTCFVILLEFAVFGRRPSLAELLVVFVLLCATVLASGAFSIRHSEFSFNGIIIALLGTLSYAVYVVANGHINTSRSWLLKSALIMTGSSIAIFVAGFNQIAGSFNFSASFLPWGIGFAVFGTTIPTALFSLGIPKIGACLSSILMTVELPVAVICARFILGEQIDILQTCGIALMFFAIIFINYYRSKRI